MHIQGSRGKAGGYTLTEILVTVAIIGLLAGLATMNVYRQLPQWRLDQAVNQVFSDFRKARVAAVSHASDVTIQLNDGAGTYTITVGGQTETKSIAGIPGVSMASSPAQLTFRPNGTMLSGSLTHSITLSSPGLTSREIRTVPNGQVDLVK